MFLQRQADWTVIRLWFCVWLIMRSQALFDAIVRARDTDGRLFCVHFLELPSEEELPMYYKVIPNPVSLADVASKMASTRTRYSYRELLKDLRRMFTNAKKFNEPACQVYRDAVVLQVPLFPPLTFTPIFTPIFTLPLPSPACAQGRH